MILTCQACHKQFEAKRKDAKFCSTQCRSRTHTGTRAGRHRIPDDLRHSVLARDKYRCRMCGAAPGNSELRVDHAISLEDGGAPLDSGNLITLCHPCNSGKGRASIRPEDIPPPNVVSVVLDADIQPETMIECEFVELRPTAKWPNVYEVVVYG